MSVFDRPTVDMGEAAQVMGTLGEKIKLEDHGHDTPCWVWQKFINPDGYGMGWDPKRKRVGLAHRISYDLLHGTVPPILDHVCRVRACVNPAHLEPVDHRTNVRRASKLSLEDIEDILACDDSYSVQAARYGVTFQTIGYYKSGTYARRHGL